MILRLAGEYLQCKVFSKCTCHQIPNGFFQFLQHCNKLNLQTDILPLANFFFAHFIPLATNNAAPTRTKSAAAPTKTKPEEPKTKKPKMLNVGQSHLKSSEQAFMNRLEAKTTSLAANVV